LGRLLGGLLRRFLGGFLCRFLCRFLGRLLRLLCSLLRSFFGFLLGSLLRRYFLRDLLGGFPHLLDGGDCGVLGRIHGGGDRVYRLFGDRLIVVHIVPHGLYGGLTIARFIIVSNQRSTFAYLCLGGERAL